MELEELKAAYQQAKAAHPRKDPHEIMLDTKRKAEERDRDFKRQQWTQILCSLFCLQDTATWYSKEGPLLANVGLILMLLCLALMVAGIIILRYRLRESHPWLPDEEFLNEERKKIEAQIALLRRNALWLFIPAVAGLRDVAGSAVTLVRNRQSRFCCLIIVLSSCRSILVLSMEASKGSVAYA